MCTALPEHASDLMGSCYRATDDGLCRRKKKFVTGRNRCVRRPAIVAWWRRRPTTRRLLACGPGSAGLSNNALAETLRAPVRQLSRVPMSHTTLVDCRVFDVLIANQRTHSTNFLHNMPCEKQDIDQFHVFREENFDIPGLRCFQITYYFMIFLILVYQKWMNKTINGI